MSDELGESELGTKEYWNSLYEVEIKNFRDHGDVGETWFGEDISDRVVQWLDRGVPKNSAIMDVGCGNGILLVELWRRGFTNLLGIDYSLEAIVLAREVSKHCGTNISFTVSDILTSKVKENEFNVVLDKGTYDAISLMKDAKTNRENYIKSVHDCLKQEGLLIITSCNWTREELMGHFENLFEELDVIPTPQFKFGGKVGSVVSSVVFKKKMLTNFLY